MRPQVLPAATTQSDRSTSKPSANRSAKGGWAPRIATPGADRSTVAAPKLEKSARLSSRSLAATQMTFGASSTHGATGLKSVLTASLPELATKRVEGAARMASSSTWEMPKPPKLAFTIRAP